jgi:hypothetical protein
MDWGHVIDTIRDAATAAGQYTADGAFTVGKYAAEHLASLESYVTNHADTVERYVPCTSVGFGYVTDGAQGAVGSGEVITCLWSLVIPLLTHLPVR